MRILGDSWRLCGYSAQMPSSGGCQVVSSGLQRAAGQVRGHVVIGQLHDAVAGQRRLRERVAAVAAQAALHPQRAAFAVFADKPVLVAAQQAVVLLQRGQRLWRTVRGQVGRRGADVQMAAGQPARDQAGVGQLADADGQVVAIVHQVQHLVAQLQLDVQRRVALAELQQQRRDVALAVGQRRGDFQAALRRGQVLRHRALGFAQRVQQLAAVLQVELAGVGQRDVAGGAVQQLGTQPRLQPCQLAAHLRYRQPQRLRGAGKAAVFRHGGKFAHPFPCQHYCTL